MDTYLPPDQFYQTKERITHSKKVCNVNAAKSILIHPNYCYEQDQLSVTSTGCWLKALAARLDLRLQRTTLRPMV